MHDEITESPVNPFSRFIPLVDYVRARPEIFQTRSASVHLLRHRRVELQLVGALIRCGRQLMIDAELADKMILEFFRKDGSIKPRHKSRQEYLVAMKELMLNDPDLGEDPEIAALQAAVEKADSGYGTNIAGAGCGD